VDSTVKSSRRRRRYARCPLNTIGFLDLIDQIRLTKLSANHPWVVIRTRPSVRRHGPALDRTVAPNLTSEFLNGPSAVKIERARRLFVGDFVRGRQ
jgi:hypothetical protein